MIETVFLDAGGVLVFPNWSRISAALQAHGVTVSPAALAAAEPTAKRRLDVTETIQQTTDASRGWVFFNFILEDAGIPRTAASDAALAELQAYHQASNLWELVPDEVVPALKAMRTRGLRLVVVSNANCRLKHAFDRLDLSRYFDCVLDSCEEGVEKPDPRIFEIALERSGARRDTTVHVGDIYQVDVIGARRAGIRPILLDAAGLYEDADCPRVQSMADLEFRFAQGSFEL